MEIVVAKEKYLNDKTVDNSQKYSLFRVAEMLLQKKPTLRLLHDSLPTLLDQFDVVDLHDEEAAEDRVGRTILTD